MALAIYPGGQFMKKLLVFLFFLIGCDEENLYPVNDCNQPCVVLETGELLVREEAEFFTCNTGTLVCTDTKEECVGYKLKSHEECNGLDDDCDGEIDEVAMRPFTSELNTCPELPGICAWSAQKCIGGQWVCMPPEGIYGEEICDHIDNDCDGEIDNNIQFTEPMFGYDGPIETINIGECRGWARKCINGNEIKDGQVLPISEVCDNGKDDDCDGWIDENDDDSVEESFLLLIDVSGSMDGWNTIVTSTLCSWSLDSRFTDSKFAIQIVGLMSWKETDDWEPLESPFNKVLADFGSAAQACTALTDMQYKYLSGGLEFVPQAMLESHTGLELHWPEDLDKNVVVFSDEAPQSLPVDGSPLVDPTWQNDLVVQHCNLNEYKVGVFTSYYLHSEWADITDGCNGWVETLEEDEEEMTELLNVKFRGKC
jgi:hypothetical protein